MAEHTTAAPWSLPYPDPTGKVRLGATDFKELAERLATLLGEKLLIIKTYAAAANLKSGELAEQTKAGETFTLPAAGTANQVIGVFCGAASCKITTSGGAFIVGGGLTAASKTGTITLLEDQHVLLQSNGTNWLIVGEGGAVTPSTIAKASAALGRIRVSGTEYEESATRPALVVATVEQFHTGQWAATFFRNGHAITTAAGEFNVEGGQFAIVPVTFVVAPGEKWKYVNLTVNTQVAFSITLL